MVERIKTFDDYNLVNIHIAQLLIGVLLVLALLAILVVGVLYPKYLSIVCAIGILRNAHLALAAATVGEVLANDVVCLVVNALRHRRKCEEYGANDCHKKLFHNKLIFNLGKSNRFLCGASISAPISDRCASVVAKRLFCGENYAVRAGVIPSILRKNRAIKFEDAEIFTTFDRNIV